MNGFQTPMPRPLRFAPVLFAASMAVGCDSGSPAAPGNNESDPRMPATPYASDREALVDLYNSTEGDSWTDNAGWPMSDDHCSWFGVTCSDGRVIQLSLHRNNLSGTIPAELGGLSALRSLDLSFNGLSGTIPAELGGLSAFRSLDLSFNDLSGTIPVELGSLDSLTTLGLSYNGLSGSIPADLGDLMALHTLRLSFNNLSGPIPAELGNLTALWMVSR